MKLQQLEYVLEIVRQGFHISAAAQALHTSQPGVSRQLQLLESELGFAIFARTRNRIEGLTEAGTIAVELAQRVVRDVQSLTSLRDELTRADEGVLTIATTHTQAKYVLPSVISSFVKAHPRVQVVLMQGSPDETHRLVDEGAADVAVGTEPVIEFPNLVKLACFDLTRIVVVPDGHPLTRLERLTLDEIAKYPIITYDDRFSGYWTVRRTFERAGLTPRVVMSAIDADVSKTYVSTGLGIGILTGISYDVERDAGLTAIPADDIFDSSTVYARVRANSFPRAYLLDFIQRIAPHLTPDYVRARITRPAT